jgi:methionyl-tRNA formyltransferase
MKVNISSSREIGGKCVEWAKKNMPEGWEYVEYKEDCDVFISLMYDELLTEEFLKNRRCYNFHPGILPMYRGAGVFSWVLINGDKECGITLHEIDKDIDHGAIIEIRKFIVEDKNTAQDLYEKGMVVMESMFVDYFRKLLENEYTTQGTVGIDRMYYRKDLEKKKDISNIVRAFTFEGKENSYFINKYGDKVEIC